MSIDAMTISSALGLPAYSDLELAGLVKSGLALGARDGLLQLGLTPAEVARHVISPRTWKHRTLQRRKGDRDTFSAEESGRILRVTRMVLRATELFGDRDLGLTWLRAPKSRFAGQTPLEMAETEHGAALVEEWILGAEEGFAA